MKHKVTKTMELMRSVCIAAFLYMAFSSETAQAGLNLEMNSYVYGYGNSGAHTYVFYTPLTTNAIAPAAAVGTYVIMSPGWPTNGSRRGFEMTTTNGLIDRTEFDSENGYSDFNSMLNQITNGSWSILYTNATATNLYKFTVKAPGLTSNAIPLCQIGFPLDTSLITTSQTNYSFQGPASWPVTGYGEVYNNDFSYVVSANLAPTSTIYSPAPPPAPGDNYTFYINFQTNLVTNVYVVSTPLSTNASTPISGWSSSAVFSTSASVNYGVFTPGVPSSGHTNIAWYTFEDNSLFAHDYSESGNNINGYGYYTNPPYITNVAKSGLHAVGFSSDGQLSPNTNMLPVLARSFSVSLWFRSTQVHGNNTDDQYSSGGLFSALSGDYGTAVLPIGFTGSKMAFYTGASNSSDNIIHSQANINTGQYVHLVATRDQLTGEKKIYVNGALDTSVYASRDVLAGANTIYIGQNNGQTISGSIDEIQVYSGVLSASEVATLYNNPGTVISNTAAASPFNSALNTTNLNWSTSGDTSWFIESTNTHDGSLALRSGIVTNNQASTLSVTVTGPGTLSFYWSSFAEDPAENFDYEFDLDGIYKNDIYGDTPWAQDGPYTIASGTHTLTWVVRAYGDTDPTQAGYLDQVGFIPDSSVSAPVITLNPLNQTNYTGYYVWLEAAANAPTNSSLSWQWFKVGSGAVLNATNAYYIPTNPGTAGVAGNYFAVASNPGGSATTTTSAVSFVSIPTQPDWSMAFKSPFYPVDNTTVTKDYYYGCFVDTNGNVFTGAEFTGNTLVGSSNLNSGAGGHAAALVKTSPAGATLWAAGITNNGNGNASAYGVASAPGGGAYVAGNFYGTNWAGTNKLSDNGNGDIFIARYDANGSNIWVKTFGGTNNDFTLINCLASDPAGNATLIGLLSSGPVTVGASNYNITGQEGILFQLDSNGVVRWSQLMPSEFPQYLTYCAGRLYVSFGTATTGGTTNMVIGGVSNLTDRTWAVASLNSTNGQVVWLRGVGTQYGAGVGNPYSAGIIDDVPRLAVSGTNLFLTGVAYGSNAAFGGITVNFNSLRGQYFARYDTNGNPQLATTFGSVTTAPLAAVADTNGNVYVSGNFDKSTYFGIYELAGPAYDPPYSGGFSHSFLAKFDRNGNPIWSREALSGLTVNFLGLGLAPDGVWASGWCQSPLSGANVATRFGTNNVFSDEQFLFGGAGGGTSIIFYPAGVLAKIRDVAVAQPVTLLFPTNTGANFKFSFISQQGFSHNILYKTNLAVGGWLTNSTVAGTGSLTNITLPISIFNGSKQGYVRVSTQ